MVMKKGPLAGIKVVEIAGIGSAPCCGMLLADMGAEVILIERKQPNANAAKGFADNDDSEKKIFNRGKRSIAVDLKSEQGVELVLTLIADADVLIEGFRPGVMERLGLGPDICLDRNPKLVYGRMTGWGQTGPLAHAAGHDPNYIGVSGALAYAAREGKTPSVPLTLIGDIGGGTMVLACGILCGVIHAQRTGQGQVIDAAITDGSAYLTSLLWFMHNTDQIDDQPGSGWADGAAPWNDCYACADGRYITICALEPLFYKELIQRLELEGSSVFAQQWDRDFWPQGKKILEHLFLEKRRDQWCELLEGTDACFAPVLKFSEAVKHPHNVARETFLNIGGVVQPAPAPKFSRSEPRAGLPPKTGEHSDDVLLNVGLDQVEITRLKAEGVVG
jgi:alpha-methylacyl-CoA racemase